ncbi:glycosyltransferase [Microbacterium sp. zg.Y1090]|uniref:glycosyltransferase n=1 Tax=Microbacterium TaxID=33882 RepID=UPI00214C308D|nr:MULTISPECIES: glycosyltransferase [unclassified Microbacterium]MCR2813596.1 glycosyltransferase [Microbacterium sp. zg.Y1084]MCR2818072.1 glycosyltransferase [Microbacterium sp. zg.Y1090]WIM27770.1 glycosyltransferase [Microbacterium sp. zg-Y1090]
MTKYIPHAGIPHAGGQYLLSHYSALQSEFDMRFIAPDTSDNRSASTLFGQGERTALVTGRGLLRGGRFKLLGDLESAWAGSAVTRNVRTAFAHGDAPWRVLEQADLIEFQWSEMMALAPLVRARLPRTPLVGIAHDVITQRWNRAAQTSAGPMRVAYRMAARRSAPRETRSFSALDRVIAFSDKDAALIREMEPSVRVETVLPGLGPLPGHAVVRNEDPAAPVVLFTGALNRADNHNGVVWFLEQVWPRVASEAPSARFVIAGAHPRPALARLVDRLPRVELTGFVDSLEPYYASATVFVAPIFTGAGVKFKTIDAMLRSVPIVATPVGAEGIDGPDVFAAVTDDADIFASAVVGTLRSPDVDATARAARWAEDHYGLRAFGGRLRGVYEDVLQSA